MHSFSKHKKRHWIWVFTKHSFFLLEHSLNYKPYVSPFLLPLNTSSHSMDNRSCDHNKLILYSYWISSCTHRVRIGLNLKGLQYEYKAVNLLKEEQSTPEFRKLNPIGYVPALVDGDNVISDSLAILLYLEEKYPQRPLLPADPNRKSINYQVANIVSSSIQPFQNSVIKFIEEKLGPDEKLAWVKHHIFNGFEALEKLLKDHAEKYATGDEVFLADLFLASQIHAAIAQFNLEMTKFPLLQRLYEAYSKLPAFQDAMPEKQPDAPAP